MVGAPQLVAGEVKQALLEALGTTWRATLDGLAVQPEAAAPEEILFAIQLVPERIQIIREASGQRRSECLVSAVFSGVCSDDGTALREAAHAYVAGILAAHVEDAADRALRYARATRGQGGLLLVVRPWTGQTRLFLAKAGEDLSNALDLGGIENAPMRAH